MMHILKVNILLISSFSPQKNLPKQWKVTQLEYQSRNGCSSIELMGKFTLFFS